MQFWEEVNKTWYDLSLNKSIVGLMNGMYLTGPWGSYFLGRLSMFAMKYMLFWPQISGGIDEGEISMSAAAGEDSHQV